ncbi:hypothetical protein Bca4012_080698 [Brassica carinata]
MDSNPPESLPYSMLLNCFGRVAIQIFRNERTHDFHMFMSSLLQLFDLVYGEFSKFLFGLLWVRTNPKKMQPQQE